MIRNICLILENLQGFKNLGGFLLKEIVLFSIYFLPMNKFIKPRNKQRCTNSFTPFRQ